MRMLALSLMLMMPVAVSAQGSAIVIRNANIETLGAAGRLERATLVIRNGKIVAAGKEVAIPDDADVIDAAGGTIMPGIIDPYFEVAIAGGTADAGSRTVVIRGRAVTVPGAGAARGPAYTRISDNFYPHDPGFKPLPRVGLTRLNLVASGVGQAAVVRVTPADPLHMLDKPDGVAYVTISNQTDSLDLVRTRLEAATKAKAATDPVKAAAASLSGPLWLDVLEGKAALIASVPNPASAVQLLKAIEPYKAVKLVMAGAGATFVEAIDSLKGRNVRVILRPNFELIPNTRDRMAPARVLQEAGIDVAFTMTARGGADADTPDEAVIQADAPLFPIAMLVRSGLPRQSALESLCKKPAAILGLDSTLGTIEPGKTADLLLFTGDPLDPASRLRLTIIDGRTNYANN